MNALYTRLKPHLAPLILLALMLCAVYSETGRHDFLINWDDNVYITENETIRSLTWGHIKDAFSRFYIGNYAPLQIISYMFDYALWGMKAPGFILTNIVLHFLCGILVYALIVLMHGSRLWAGTAAFLFLLHPVQVESVAWISQRKNILALFFFLLAWLLRELSRRMETRGERIIFCCSVLSFLLSLLAKSAGVVLPLVLICRELLCLDRIGLRKALLVTTPYWVLACAAGVMTMVTQGRAGGIVATYHGGSPWHTFLTMVTVFPRYLGLILWPTRLSASYAPAVKTSVDPEVVLSGALMLLIFAGSVLLYRQSRQLFFWELFALISLLPVSQIVPLTTLMNDRYLYFPLMGVASMAGGLVAGLWRTPGWRRSAAAVLVVCLMLFPALSFQRYRVWESSLTLWRDTVAKEPGSGAAWCGYGDALSFDGYSREALDAYLRSHAIAPTATTTQNIGTLYTLLGDPLRGRPYLVALAADRPGDFAAQWCLGDNYLKTNELDLAAKAYETALAIQPRNVVLLGKLGEVSLRRPDAERAAACFAMQAAVEGVTPPLEYKMACAAALAGRQEEAIRHFSSACAHGFSAFHVMRSEGYLGPLRALPAFRDILKRYER